MVNKISYLFGQPKTSSLEGEKQPYIAVNPINDEEHPKRYDGVTIFYEDGFCKEIINYNYLLRAFCTDSTKLTIFSTEGVYLIEGQHAYPLKRTPY